MSEENHSDENNETNEIEDDNMENAEEITDEITDEYIVGIDLGTSNSCVCICVFLVRQS